MKNSSRIFILVLVLLVFLAGLASAVVRRLADVFYEFDHVAQVDLVLMEGATSLNNLQLKKEIVFAKLSASAEELAFGQANPSRQEYLADYLKGLSQEYRGYVALTESQIKNVQALAGVPFGLRHSFSKMERQAKNYDATVESIFKAVQAGGFQLSLEDLDRTDAAQKSLMENFQEITSEVWALVHESIHRSQRWHSQSKFAFWLSLSLTAMLGFLLFAFKRNVEKIETQKKGLEKLNQELDRFAHTVGHDIAGPLTTIVGYAAYLESKYAPQLDEKGRDCIQGVRKGATRLNVLIKDMLELTKLSRVKNPYSRVSVQEAVNSAQANCDFLVRQTHTQIIVDRPLPEITGDRVKLTAALTNLISNAMKFVKPGESPRIHIGWNETREAYEFYVQDNGVGIDPSHHKDIFDIFKRLNPAEDNTGSGIGLTIVKAAIEDHGGRVWVESTPGHGSKFVFTIPKNLQAAKPLY